MKNILIVIPGMPTEKLSHFQTIMIINVKQKEEIKNLKQTISELKSKKSVI